MVKLDKSKKLDHKTYFFYPRSFELSLLELMHNSKEKDFRTYDHEKMTQLVPKEYQIDDLQYYEDSPDIIDPWPRFCVSYYDPKYLFNKIEEHLHDPNEIEKGLNFSDRAIQIAKNDGTL